MRVRQAQRSQWDSGVLKKHRGQSLPEYATTLAMITLFCLAALTMFGSRISDFLIDTGNLITTLTVGGG